MEAGVAQSRSKRVEMDVQLRSQIPDWDGGQ